MENYKPEYRGFRPKTPEELESQTKFSKLEVSMDYWGKSFDVPADFTQKSPEEIQALLENERERVKREGGTSQLLDDYNTYIATLKKIRQQQGAKRSETLTRDAYLKAVNFSSATAEKMLKLVQKGPEFSRLNRVFTDEQIEIAIQNESSFLSLLEQVLKRSPQLIFRTLTHLAIILPKPQIQEVLDLAINQDAWGFLQNFEAVKKYYPEAELKSKILQIAEKKPNALFIYLEEEPIQQFFSEEEIKQLVIKSAATVSPHAFERKRVNEYVKKGYLTESEVRQLVIGIIGKSSEGVSCAKQFIDLFPENERENLKVEISRAYTRENNTASIYDLETLPDFFSEEEKKEILRNRLEGNMGYCLELARKILGDEETRTYFQKAITKREYSIFSNVSNITRLLSPDNEFLSESQKREFVKIAFASYPTYAMQNLDLFLSFYTEEQKPIVVKELVENIGPYAVNSVEKWIGFYTQDPAEQKQIIKNQILEGKSYSFVKAFLSGPTSDNLIPKLFTKDEILEILNRKIELGAEDAFSELLEIRNLLGNDQEFKKFITRASEQDPQAVIANLEEVGYLYTPAEIQNLVENAARTMRGASAALYGIGNWGSILGNKYAWNFIQRHLATLALEASINIDKCLPFVPAEGKDIFLEELMRINPPVALHDLDTYQRNLKGVNLEQCISLGLDDEKRMSFAPKTLTEFYRKVSKAKSVETLEPIIIEAAEKYTSIAMIQNTGLTEAFKKIQVSQEISVKKEGELLATFYCFAILKEKFPEQFGQIENFGTSLEEANSILMSQLGNRLGLDRSFDEEESKRFFEAFGTPAPFLTYLLQYENSPQHKKLLKEMLQAVIEDRYTDWKQGVAGESELKHLKEAKLFPSGLTSEQHISWRKDDETTLHETLAADAQSVAVAIRQTLLENLEHIQIEALDMGGKTPDNILGQTGKELATIGREIAIVNKQLSDLGRSGQTGSLQYNVLAEQSKTLKETRSALIMKRDFFKLVNLTHAEVASGYFLEGNDVQKKVAPIGKVLRELKSQIPEEGRFVMDRIEKLLESFRTQSQEKQNLTCRDSSSPKIIIEIGEKPVASCQNYAHGSHNDCLLGYTDPNSKILVLENEKGNLVARSIFRLLETSDGHPALHIERIYSSTGSVGVLRTIYTHALKKANEMGVPLFISKKSQNEQGIETEAQLPSDIESNAVDYNLISRGSRAPKVYVDSAGGARSWGNYKLSDLMEIKTRIS